MSETSAPAAAPLRSGHDGTPARTVCAALTLALVVLALRIAAVW
jgi:hypothetical protein